MSASVASQSIPRCVLLAEQGANPGRGRKSRKDRRRFLHQSVCDALRWWLSQAAIKYGSRLPSLRELAKRFHVSTITVRQALRALEKEGQVQCIPGVGVFTASIAPETATRQAAIAFATIEIENALTAQVTECMGEVCLRRTWSMQLFGAHGDTELEARNLAYMAKSGLKGAVIVPADSTENIEAMVRLKLNGCPIVLIGRAVPGLQVDVVESDHEKGAYLAAEYLLTRGHRHVLMVTPKSMPTTSSTRLRGYEQALADHGLEPLRGWKVWIDDALTAQGRREGKNFWGGYAAVLPVLKESEPPIAVLAHDAHSGWGVFEACRELGLNIPNDVSIVCLDDAEFTQALSPPMTAIRERTKEVACAAVELLERRLLDEAGPRPQHVLVDVELIERGSVARQET